MRMHLCYRSHGNEWPLHEFSNNCAHSLSPVWREHDTSTWPRSRMYTLYGTFDFCACSFRECSIRLCSVSWTHNNRFDCLFAYSIAWCIFDYLMHIQLIRLFGAVHLSIWCYSSFYSMLSFACVRLSIRRLCLLSADCCALHTSILYVAIHSSTSIRGVSVHFINSFQITTVLNTIFAILADLLFGSIGP